MAAHTANEAAQIEKLALALKKAEERHTSFNHYLSYHREVAATLYEEGVRIIDVYWRIDVQRQNEAGKTVHDRLGYRFETEQHALDWIQYHEQDGIQKGHTFTVNRER